MSEQRILGKAPPESSELQKAADAGFEAVELYLEEKHLERMSQSADAVSKLPRSEGRGISPLKRFPATV